MMVRVMKVDHILQSIIGVEMFAAKAKAKAKSTVNLDPFISNV